MVSPIRSSDVNRPVPHSFQKPRRTNEDWHKKHDPKPLPPIEIKPSAEVLPKPVQGKYEGTKPMPPVHIKFDPAYDGSFFKIPKPVQEQKKGEGLFVGPPVRIDDEKKDEPIFLGPPVRIDQEKLEDPILVGPPVKINKKWAKCSAVDLYYPAQDSNACADSISCGKKEKQELAAA